MDSLDIILGGCIVVFLLWLGWKLRLAWKNFLFSLVRRRGRSGENKAVKLLKRNGYKIIQSQVPMPGHLYVDNKKINFNTRADYLVERGGMQYVAEVKTGNAAKVKNIATRRQLFEYASLCKTDTIILVDATSSTVKKIRFDS